MGRPSSAIGNLFAYPPCSVGGAGLTQIRRPRFEPAVLSDSFRSWGRADGCKIHMLELQLFVSSLRSSASMSAMTKVEAPPERLLLRVAGALRMPSGIELPAPEPRRKAKSEYQASASLKSCVRRASRATALSAS